MKMLRFTCYILYIGAFFEYFIAYRKEIQNSCAVFFHTRCWLGYVTHILIFR